MKIILPLTRILEILIKSTRSMMQMYNILIIYENQSNLNLGYIIDRLCSITRLICIL